MQTLQATKATLAVAAALALLFGAAQGAAAADETISDSTVGFSGTSGNTYKPSQEKGNVTISGQVQGDEWALKLADNAKVTDVGTLKISDNGASLTGGSSISAENLTISGQGWNGLTLQLQVPSNGGPTIAVANQMTVNGTVSMGGGSITAGTLTVQGDGEATTGTLSFYGESSSVSAGDVHIDKLEVNDLTAEGATASVSSEGAVVIGSAAIHDAATISAKGEDGVRIKTLEIWNNGALTIGEESEDAQNQTLVADTVTLNGDAAKLTVNGDLTVNGELTLWKQAKFDVTDALKVNVINQHESSEITANELTTTGNANLTKATVAGAAHIYGDLNSVDNGTLTFQNG